MAMPTWQGFGAVEGSIGTLTPTMPTGIQADDILLLAVHTWQAEACTLSTPNGFVETASSPQRAIIGGGHRLTTFWKRAVGSDSAPLIADAGDHVIAVMCLTRGCKTSGDPWNTSSGNSDTGSNTSVAVTGATTTAANCLVVVFISGVTLQSWTSQANADLANVTERVDGQSGAGTDGSLCVVTGEKASAGAYGNTTATANVSTYDASITLALEGAAAAPTSRTKPSRLIVSDAVHRASRW